MVHLCVRIIPTFRPFATAGNPLLSGPNIQAFPRFNLSLDNTLLPAKSQEKSGNLKIGVHVLKTFPLFWVWYPSLAGIVGVVGDWVTLLIYRVVMTNHRKADYYGLSMRKVISKREVCDTPVPPSPWHLTQWSTS